MCMAKPIKTIILQNFPWKHAKKRGKKELVSEKKVLKHLLLMAPTENTVNVSSSSWNLAIQVWNIEMVIPYTYNILLLCVLQDAFVQISRHEQ